MSLGVVPDVLLVRISHSTVLSRVMASLPVPDRANQKGLKCIQYPMLSPDTGVLCSTYFSNEIVLAAGWHLQGPTGHRLGPRLPALHWCGSW